MNPTAHSARTLESVIDDMRDLFLPRSCVACGQWGAWLCQPCVVLLDPAPPPRTIRLPCSCRSLHVATATSYAGVGQAVVVAYKDRGIRSLSSVMSGWLRPFTLACGGGASSVRLVPVPPRSASRRKRGFDHVGLLCSELALGSGPSCRDDDTQRIHHMPLLRWQNSSRWRKRTWYRPKAAGPQKTLAAQARRTNVAGQITVLSQASTPDEQHTAGKDHQAGSRGLLLVDDVVTTGATLAECHRALCEKGVAVTRAVALCSVADGR